jgi:hypothetical protein
MPNAATQLSRPYPPEELTHEWRLPESFVPAPDLEVWVRAAFLAEASPLYNAEHVHLHAARIGFLWTNVHNQKRPLTVAGTAECPNPKGGTWQRKRQVFQIVEWFGFEPDFIVTLDALVCSQIDDLTFCALVEHELYHCGQALDEFNLPKFSKEGIPRFALRPHDVEQFTGIVSRYGADASGVTEMVVAAAQKPTIGRAAVGVVCGTCLRSAA